MTKKPSGNRAHHAKTATKSKRADPAARRRPSGRVTPKGTRPAGHTHGTRPAPAASSRYTPPTPRSAKGTQPWVPYLFFGFLAVGVVGVFLNYLSVLPGAPSWWWLGGSLACIFASVLTASQFR